MVKKFLIVEDNESIRRLYEDVLADKGVEAQYAATAADAQELFNPREYDAVITDMSLPLHPGEDPSSRAGRTLIRYVRANDRTIPIVLASSHSDYVQAPQERVYVLEKPFNVVELARILDLIPERLDKQAA